MLERRALLLSGGASRGAVQIPVINYLAKNYHYDRIYGVSVGALNGVMFAQEELPALNKLWEETDGIESFLSMRWYWPFNGLYSMKPLRKKIQAYVDLKKIKIPFTAGVVSFTDGEYYSISSDTVASTLDLQQAIEASSCMAGLMIPPKIKINGEEHIGCDGGFRNIIGIPRETNYDYVDIVACTPLDRMKMKGEKFYHRDLCNVVLRSIEVFEDENFDKDIYEIQHSQHGEIRIFAPDQYPGTQLDASKETIQFRFELGERAIKNPIYLKK